MSDQRNNNHIDTVLGKLREAWMEQRQWSFMELMLENLPEEDIFWTTDEQLVSLLDGIDPWSDENDSQDEGVSVALANIADFMEGK